MFRSLPELKRAICLTIAAASFGFLGHSDPAAADFLTEAGGSNLVFISQHEYTPLPLGSVETGNCRYAVGDARSVIAVYDVAKTAIDAKLRSLYAAGQRKISLVLWHFFNQYTYAPPQTTYLNTYCEMVFADGVLSTKHQANLSALIATIKTIGFTQINFRFVPMDVSNPMEWNSWDEAQFQSNWNLIWQTRQLIYQSLNAVPGATPPRVLFDLGAELSGMWAVPQQYGPVNPEVLRRYVTTLWSVYTSNYGVSDTTGFSIAPGFSGQISAQISAYDSTTGGRPNAYGFDLYGNEPAVAAGDYSSFDTQLDFISSELGAAGELSKELFVQETYFNSMLARNALSRAPQKGISFRYLFQWPYRAGHATDVVDVFDLSPYFSYTSNGAPYPFSPLFFPPGTFIYQDNLYYTNGHDYCQYTTVGPYTGGTVARIPANMRNVGFCSPAIPTGWFRVSDRLYYSYGSRYCSSRGPDADHVSGSTVFWGIFSGMTYLGLGSCQ